MSLYSVCIVLSDMFSTEGARLVGSVLITEIPDSPK